MKYEPQSQIVLINEFRNFSINERKFQIFCFLLTTSGPFQDVSHIHSFTYANFHVSMYTSPKHLSEQGTLANAHQPQHVLIFTVGKFPLWNKDMHKGIKVRWGFVYRQNFSNTWWNFMFLLRWSNPDALP